MVWTLDDLDALLTVLADSGYEVIGPTVRDGAIVYDRLGAAAELPAGWTEDRDAGRYRLRRRSDEKVFGYTVGPRSWKRYLYPPRVTVWSGRRTGDGFETVAVTDPPPRYAFVGVRPCDLAAIRVQDEVFAGRDPIYEQRRERALVVAVNCTEPSGTCFCQSMGTGPAATGGFDLALTELDGRFLVEAGSDAGRGLVERLPLAPATGEDREVARRSIADATQRMGRTLDTDDIKGLLYANAGHARWEEVAGRCLTCTNCTMVCPTCFCGTVEDGADLAGEVATRVRVWDSCFTLDFSYIHGGPVRSGVAARYRQWLTHKLASWIDQFGTSGCVGCGRCITWCPVGIDITEEVAAIRAADLRSTGREEGP